jgi:hypothetical protein
MRLGFKLKVLTRRRIFLGGVEPKLSFTSLRLSLGSTQIEIHCSLKLIVNVHFTDLKHWLNFHFLIHLFLSLEPSPSLSLSLSLSLQIPRDEPTASRDHHNSKLSLSLSLSLSRAPNPIRYSPNKFGNPSWAFVAENGADFAANTVATKKLKYFQGKGLFRYFNRT